MMDLQLLIDLHKNNHRQGPGGDAETRLAIELSKLDKSAPLRIADIGCGTGASTLVLAQDLAADITAVDFLPEFLEALKTRAAGAGVADRISTLSCPMESLPFGDGDFDVLWSEGAIYNMGFEKGVAGWNRYLKVGGVLVVSEITWTTSSRPSELQKHWDAEYPEIDVASSKISILEKNGYSPIGYFVLPEHCWFDNYYRPMQKGFQRFLDRHDNSKEARAVVEAEEREIELYEKYGRHYSYGVYVARKCG